MEEKRAKNSTDSSEQQSEGMSSPAIKIYYKIIVIKTTWFWCKYRQDQLNNIKSSETDPCTCENLVCDQDGIINRQEMNSINGLSQVAIQKVKLDPQFTPYMIIHFKWIKDNDIKDSLYDSRIKKFLKISHIKKEIKNEKHH